MEQALRLVVVLFAALTAGGLMVSWIGLGRGMSRLSDSAHVEFHQAANRTFDPCMPVVVALLGGIFLAIFSQGSHSLSAKSAIAGSVCDVAVLVIALATNFRINKQIARRSVQSPPDEWAPTRARWVRFHVLPALFSLPGLASCALACPVSRCSVVGS